MKNTYKVVVDEFGIGRVNGLFEVTFSENDNQLSVENNKLLFDAGNDVWKVVLTIRYKDIKANLKDEYSFNQFKEAIKRYPGELWRESADVICMFEGVGSRDLRFSEYNGHGVGFIPIDDQIVVIDEIYGNDEWIYRSREVTTLNTIVRKIEDSGRFEW